MLLKNKVNTTNKLNIVLCSTMHFGLPIPYFAELFWLSNTAERTYKKSKKGIYLRSTTHISSTTISTLVLEILLLIKSDISSFLISFVCNVDKNGEEGSYCKIYYVPEV